MVGRPNPYCSLLRFRIISWVIGFHVKIMNNLLWNALTDSERGWTTMKPWPHIPFYFLAIFWQGGWSNQTPEYLGRRKTVDLNSTVDWADGWGGSEVVLIRKVPVIWSERTLGHQKDSGEVDCWTTLKPKPTPVFTLISLILFKWERSGDLKWAHSQPRELHSPTLLQGRAVSGVLFVAL